MHNAPENVTDAIVKGAIEYIREHAFEGISADDVAARAGYSPRRFRAIFKHATGTGVARAIASVRLERAAKLLAEEGLPVSRVAQECGYDDPTWFCVAFKHAYGKTPSAYQAALWKGRDERGPRPLFADDFARRAPGTDWQVRAGEWTCERRSLAGESNARCVIARAQDLPQSCLVRVRACARPLAEARMPQLEVSLAGREGMPVVRLVLCADRTFSYLIADTGSVAFARSGVEPGRWHEVSLQATGTRMIAAVDRREILTADLLFPVAYDRRCRLVLGGYFSEVRFRGLQVFLLPSMPETGGEAVGDAFRAAGRYGDAAREYETIARDEPRKARALFKAADCYLRVGARDAALAGFRSVLDVTNAGRYAMLASLEIAALANDAELEKTLAGFLESPEHRDTAHLLGEDRVRSAMGEGQFARAAGIARVLVERGAGLPRTPHLRDELAHALTESGRFAEAATLLAAGAERLGEEPFASLPPLLEAAYLHALMGDGKAAARFLERARAFVRDDFAEGQWAVTASLVRRCAGDDAESERLLRRIALEDSPRRLYGQLGFCGALIGRGAPVEEASGVLEGLAKGDRASSLVARAYFAFAGRRFREAAGLLAEAYPDPYDRDLRPRARLLAGILLLADGSEGAAREMLLPIVHHLPSDAREAMAAGFYLGHETRETLDAALARLPFTGPVLPRAVFLYAEGVRLEAGGRRDEAVRCYERTVRTDPSRFWPAVLAGRRLQIKGTW